MGDGRYYTFYQFFAVLLLLLLSGGAIISFVHHYYRMKKTLINRQLLGVFFALIVLLILKVVEVVMPYTEVGKMLRYFVLSIHSFLLIYVFGMIVCNSFQSETFRERGYQILKYTGLLLIGVVYLGTKNNYDLFNGSYYYFWTTYNEWYSDWILIFLVMSGIFLAYKLNRGDRIHPVYNNGFCTILAFLTVFLPYTLYWWLLKQRVYFIDFMEFGLYFLLIFFLNVLVHGESEFGLTARVFEGIGDNIHDYVFVTDEHGTILYKNKLNERATFFNRLKMIDFDHLEALFTGAVEIKRNADGHEYIKVKLAGENFYFNKKQSVLKNDDVIIGYILTIMDITKLMDLLYALEQQQEKSKIMHAKLKNYSQVVYHMEKEKAINNLLDEIIVDREQEMQALTSQINQLSKNIGADNMGDCIEETIAFNARILEDVRQTVTAYQHYYGGTK